MNTKSALDSVHRPGRYSGFAGAFILSKKKSMKGDGGYLVPDGVCLFLGQVSERVERAGAAMPVERLLATVLGELSTAKWLVSFANCVREWIFEDEVRLLDGDGRVMFVKSGFISREFCSSLESNEGVWNVI